VKFFTQNVTLLGTVTDTGDPAQARDWFDIRCRSGDEFRIHIGAETQCVVLQNPDGLDRDRVATPKMPDGMTYDDSNRAHEIYKYSAGLDELFTTSCRSLLRCTLSRGRGPG
jgi:hypothetical protein